MAKNPRNIALSVHYWLNFEHLCKRSKLLNEKLMAFPISQYLMARYNDKVSVEHLHPKLNSSKVGSKPKIDYVVLGSGKFIELALETKWVSGSSTLFKDCLNDIIRIALLKESGVTSALLIAGKSDQLKLLLDKFEKNGIYFMEKEQRFDVMEYLNETQKSEKGFQEIRIPKFITMSCSQNTLMYNDIYSAILIKVSKKSKSEFIIAD